MPRPRRQRDATCLTDIPDARPCAAGVLGGLRPARAADPLGDKTLVVWVSPATLEQGGGSALTVDNGDGAFDGIIFGELEPKRWMPGSNGFARTQQDQTQWPAETAAAGQFVQLAIVYRGREVAVYRNGEPYAQYTMAQAAPVVRPARDRHVRTAAPGGPRHRSARSPAASRTRASTPNRSTAKTIAAPVAGPASPSDLKPWAWWSFADEGLREKTGRFNQIQLLGDVRIEDGCLVLGGQGRDGHHRVAPRSGRRGDHVGARSQRRGR